MRNLEYTDGKTRFIGYLAGEDGGAGRRPGIVVFPEAFGLGDHAFRLGRARCGMGSSRGQSALLFASQGTL
jgi:dienelactone hydrolase